MEFETFLISPTVIHESGLSPRIILAVLFSLESPMSLALITTHENCYFQRNISIFAPHRWKRAPETEGGHILIAAAFNFE
jgi:hypothetical protein